MKIFITALAQGGSSALPLLVLPLYSFGNNLEAYAEWGLYRLGIVIMSIIMLLGISVYNVKSLASGYKTNYAKLFFHVVFPFHFLCFLLIFFISSFLDVDVYFLFGVFFFSIANSLWNFLVSFFRGFDDFDSYNKFVILDSMIILSITAICVYLEFEPYYCWLFISFFKLMFSCLVIRGIKIVNLPKNEVGVSSFVRNSVLLLPFAVSNWVVNFSDRFVIELFMSRSELAHYVSRYDSSMVGGFFVTILSLYYLPKLCSGKIEITKFIKYSIFLSPIIFIVSYLFSICYLHFSGISSFDELIGDGLVFLVNLSFLFFYFYSVMNNILISRSKEFVIFRSTLLLLLLSFSSTLLFVYFFGLIGAVVAKILSLLIVLTTNCAFIFKAKKEIFLPIKGV